MISLPKQPRRADRLAFWSVLSVGGGAILSLLVLWGAGSALALSVLVAVALTSGAGFLFPSVSTTVYGWWQKLTRRASYVLVKALVYICHATVLRWCKRFGPNLDSFVCNEPQQPAWIPRSTVEPHAYHSTWHSVSPDQVERSDMSRWSVSDDRGWVFAILVYARVIALIRGSSQRTTATNIYTLF